MTRLKSGVLKHDDCEGQGFVSRPPSHQAGGLLFFGCFRLFTHYIHNFFPDLKAVFHARNQRT